MKVYTIDIPVGSSVLPVPFICDDVIYNRDEAEWESYREVVDEPLETWINRIVSGKYADFLKLPFIIHSTFAEIPNNPARLFPNAFITNVTTESAVEIGAYKWGNIIYRIDSVPSIRYYNSRSRAATDPGFPHFRAFGNSTTPYDLELELSVIPESCLKDGKLDFTNFSSEDIKVLKFIFDYNTTYARSVTDVRTAIIANYDYGNLDLLTHIEVNPFYYEDDPYGEGGKSSVAGGEGQFGKNEVSDIIAGDIPLGSVEGDASATGMYTRYLCNSRYLDTIGDWLWTTDLGLAIAKSVISLIYGDPSESLISLMSYPFSMTGLLKTRSQDLFWGHHNSGLPFHAITSAAFQIDWGVISLQEYWGNFLDYAPHTKIDLYLPWGTGFVSIDPGQCLPGTLQVVTNVEISKGSCIHNVIGNNGCVIGTFAGQCGKQVPLVSSDMASKIAGLVTAGAAGIAAGAVSAYGAGAAHAAYMGSATRYFGRPAKFMTPLNRNPWTGQEYARLGTVDPAPYQERARDTATTAGRTAGRIATSALAVNRSPVHVTRNGGFTDGSASLGIQYPYIILSRPKQSVPEEYGHHYGYPSNIYSSLALLRGYTEVGEVHLNGIPATDDELSEIDAILKGGVIL